ncbi:MAG: hypothetical protein CME28_02185 [Gemmatimonadetes bacterium]|nr:hypothetical protein [Gemmatimonadota bacterium]
MNDLFSVSNFSLEFAGNDLLLFIIPPFVGLTYVVYSRTYPEVRGKWFWILVGLRSIAFSLIIALLLEPVLAFWNRGVKNPRLLLMVDTSPSMGVATGGQTRLERVKKFLLSDYWLENVSRVDVKSWAFSHDVYAVNLDTVEALKTGGLATNIGGAVEEATRKQGGVGDLQGILLLSDGAHNLGRGPIETLAGSDVPIYSLAVGEGEMPADLQLLQAKALGDGYVGRDLVLNATLNSQGYDGKRAVVRLYDGPREIDQRSLVLLGGEQKIQFTIRPDAPGPFTYRLFLDPQPGELTRDNNEALVFARILRERIRVALVASRPSSDLAFLRRSLAADSTLNVDVIVQKSAQSFYGEVGDYTAMRPSDVLVLLGYDEDAWSQSAFELVRERVRNGMGLLFVVGTDGTGWWQDPSGIDELLPIEGRRSPFVERPTALRRNSQGTGHPLVRSSIGQRGDPWSDLPPLTGYFPFSQQRQGSLVLLENQRGVPVVVSGVYGNGKTLAALSHSFWRLDLFSSGSAGNPQTIRQFWRNGVRWLATSSSVGRVRISTDRVVYRAGDSVLFTAQVFNELLQPQEGYAVAVELDNGHIISMRDVGDGSYQATYTGAPAGEYSYSVTAEFDGSLVGQETGRFVVDKYSVEWTDVRANSMLLSELARESGGASLSIDDADQLIRDWKLRQTVVEQRWDIRLGSGWEPLFFIAIFLAAEWLIRKRLGML